MPEVKQNAIDKALALLARSHELQQQFVELHKEVEILLRGEPGIGQILKQLEAAFDTAWCARYAGGVHGHYVWSYVRDRPQLKRLIKQIDPADLEQRMQTYLRNNDPFFTQRRHPFGLFVSTVNQHAEPAAGGDLALEAPRPADCRHAPPCTSDQEHTRRRQAEMSLSVRRDVDTIF